MATVRSRASASLGGIEARSSIHLSIPQHKIITSFHSLSTSPVGYSPNVFQFSNPTPAPSPAGPFNESSSPIARTANLFFGPPRATIKPSPISGATSPLTLNSPARFNTPVTPTPSRKPGSNLKFLLTNDRVPSSLVPCACGAGRQTTSHHLKSCARFSSERERLLARNSPRTPRSPRLLGITDAQERKVVHAARKWRMRTLLGRYKLALKSGQKGKGVALPVRQKRMSSDLTVLGYGKEQGVSQKLNEMVKNLL